MSVLHTLWLALVFVALCGIWTPTPVSRTWMLRLRPVLARFEITPKVMAHVMDLREKQVYAQLALEAPMQAARLEEVWAEFPEAYDAYCIEHLTARGYACFRESALTRALEHLLDGEKRMVKMDLHGRQRAS